MGDELRIFNAASRSCEQFLATLAERARGPSPEVELAVKSILEDVRVRGDVAVQEYSRRFDGIPSRALRVPATQIRRASRAISPILFDDLARAADRIRAFHTRQKEESWFYYDTKDGTSALLGQIVRPLRRVGVYVPGGKASYPSTMLMNVIPAQVAGVPEIAVCVPAPGGELNPAVLAAAALLGVSEVYCIGGAQAVGALAYGTETVRAVDKIVGPGNVYVATAKRLVFGTVDIDMIAGPSEILIIADGSADPDFIAADLLSQAEHDELASSVLVTPSRVLALDVQKAVTRQLKRMARNVIASSSLARFGAVIVTKTLGESVTVANRLAPEHLEIMTERPTDLLADIENAGAIFLGPWTPEPLGDYAAGPNHTLPTGSTARFSSPLGVYDFVKRSSLLQFNRDGFLALADTVERLAGTEGLEAHADTIRVRRHKAKKQKNP